MKADAHLVQIDRRFRKYFVGAGAAIGALAAFIVGPAVSWLLERFDTAPLFLRIPAELPRPVAIVVLGAVGIIAGFVLFAVWDRSVGTIRVNHDAIVIAHGANAVRLERRLVSEIFLDKDELVVLDHAAVEISRTSSDSAVASELGQALTEFGYPWAGTTDPRDAQFVTWIDHSEDLEEATHALLRARARALTDGRNGTAADARDDLARRGIAVRDRGGAQQYRVAADRH